MAWGVSWGLGGNVVLTISLDYENINLCLGCGCGKGGGGWFGETLSMLALDMPALDWTPPTTVRAGTTMVAFEHLVTGSLTWKWYGET